MNTDPRDELLPERRICTCSVDRRGIVSFRSSLSFREEPWERIGFGFNESGHWNSPRKSRGLLEP